MFEKQTKKLRRRASKSYHWAKSEENCHVSKLTMKAVGLLTVSVSGFVAKGIFDAYKSSHPITEQISNYVFLTLPWLKSEASDKDPLLSGAILALIALLVVLTLLAGVVVRQAWGSTRLASLPEDKYSRPSETAQRFLHQMGESLDDYKIVGGVIEIARHPFIVSDPSISGWDCMGNHGSNSAVRIEHDFGLPFDFDPHRIKGIDAPSGANNKKYALSETPVDYLDASSRLCLKLRSTDYYTIKKFGNLLHGEDKATLRHSLASLLPEFQKIPSSFCLHFLVQLADGSVLCMLRRGNSDYAQEKIGITGEEQFSEEDMNAGPDQAMSHWFRRALCEEIFPLRATDPGMLERHWNEIKDVVKAMRVFSVFYEEEFANFSMFGFVKLDLDPDEFKRKFEELARSHATGRDKEGKYYLLSKDQAINFATTGNGHLSGIWGNQAILEFGEDKLHRPHLSSRYRLLTFLLSVGAIDGRAPRAEVPDDSGRMIASLKAELNRVTAQRDTLTLKLVQLEIDSNAGFSSGAKRDCDVTILASPSET